MKKFIHPYWYNKVPVKYENKIIYITGSTSSSLSVEVWAKIHPAYKKNLNIKNYTIWTKPIEIFKKKYKKQTNDY